LPRAPIVSRLVGENPTRDDVCLPRGSLHGIAKVGDIGRTETLLRPAGKAPLRPVLVDVVSQGDYVPSGGEGGGGGSAAATAWWCARHVNGNWKSGLKIAVFLWAGRARAARRAVRAVVGACSWWWAWGVLGFGLYEAFQISWAAGIVNAVC